MLHVPLSPMTLFDIVALVLICMLKMKQIESLCNLLAFLIRHFVHRLSAALEGREQMPANFSVCLLFITAPTIGQRL